MALTQKQLSELAIADSRRKSGTASATDIKNLNYAESQGWKPTSGSLERTLTGTTPAGGLNPQGLTMEQANDPKYWQGNKYIGVAQTLLPVPQTQQSTLRPPVQTPVPERTLGYQKSPLQAYKDLMRLGTQEAFQQGQSATDILQQYADAGTTLTTPAAVGSALSSNYASRAGRLGDIYQSTMETIQEKQKSDAEYSQMVMKGITENAPTFLMSLTGEEWDSFKNLQFTPEMQQKLQKAQQDYQLTQAPEGPSSFQEWTLAGGETGTGKSYADWLKEKQKQTGGLDIIKINGIDYVQNPDGTLSTPVIPEATTEANELRTNALKSAKELMRKFLAKEGTSAVGGSSIFQLQKIPGTAPYNFDINLKNLKSLLSLDNIKLLKGQGQVSDAERRLLDSASSKLDAGLTETEFEKVLNDLIYGLSGMEALQEKFKSAGIPGTLDDYIKQYGEEKVREVLEKTKPLSMGGNGSSDVSKIASAIGQYESGGNYQARGPVVTSGMYKGERALGKYQIMPGNLPSWSKAALGRVVSEAEFLANPQIQDQIAQNQMTKIYNQHGTVEDVASVWFSGRPLAKAGSAKDVIGTTTPNYVKNIRSIYDNLG